MSDLFYTRNTAPLQTHFILEKTGGFHGTHDILEFLRLVAFAHSTTALAGVSQLSCD